MVGFNCSCGEMRVLRVKMIFIILAVVTFNSSCGQFTSPNDKIEEDSNQELQIHWPFSSSNNYTFSTSEISFTGSAAGV